jgi:hypothetical protein
MDVTIRTNPGRYLRTQIRLSGQERGEGVRVETGALAQSERGHHLVAGGGVGDGSHGRRHGVREAGQDLLDDRCRQVLAVHPQPVLGAPGEVEPAVLVAEEQGRRSRTSHAGCARCRRPGSSSSPRRGSGRG